MEARRGFRKVAARWPSRFLVELEVQTPELVARAAAHRLAVLFEQIELRLPGRIHEADDAGNILRGLIPLLEIRQVVAVIIPGDELFVAAVCEERKALLGFAAVPVGDDHVARQALP